MDEDRLSGLETGREIVSLEEAGDGVLAAEADQPVSAERGEPARVEVDLRGDGVEDPEDLRLVRLCVNEDLLPRQLRTGHFLPGGIADHPGEVPDQKDHLVSQLLEVAHLPQDDRVAEVEVWSGRVEADLDPQRLSGLERPRELSLQLVGLDALVDSLQKEIQLLENGGKAHGGRIVVATGVDTEAAASVHYRGWIPTS